MEQYNPILNDLLEVVAEGNEFERVERLAAITTNFLNLVLNNPAGSPLTSFQHSSLDQEVAAKMRKGAQVLSSMVATKYRDRPDLLSEFAEEVGYVLNSLTCKAVSSRPAKIYAVEMLGNIGRQMAVNNRRSYVFKGLLHEMASVAEGLYRPSCNCCGFAEKGETLGSVK